MDTKSEILDYINRKETTGALLLTGEWGCGKTYLIKEMVKELNESKEYFIAVISLFGTDNTEELDKRIKFEYLQYKLSYAGKLAIKFSKIIDFFRKIAEAINTKLNISNIDVSTKVADAILSTNPLDFVTITNTIDDKPFVLIFDDFERCKINRVDLMGTINEYTENHNIKTIIVAAEYKINDKDYKEFKEKVISSTIKIKSDYISIIKNIISNYIETSSGYSQFLKDNVDFIISAFRDSKSENIRYVKSVLYDFERVYKVWSSEGIGIDNMPQILYSFLAVSIEYKLGIYVYDEKYNNYDIRANKQQIQIDINEDPTKEAVSQASERLMTICKYKDYTFSDFFTSLSRWIVNGIWNERDFIDELRQKYPTKELNDMEKFLLYYPLKLDSTTIINGLNKSLEAAYKGELTCDQLISLIKNIQSLRKLSDSIVSEVDYSKIAEGFDNRIVKIREGKISEPQRRSSIVDDQIDSSAKPIWEKILHLKDKYVAWKGYEEISNILKEEAHDWAIIRQYNTIDVFDDSLFKLFVQKYNNSSHYDKENLIRMLCELKLDDSNCSTESQIQESKENLEKVLYYIREKINDKLDDILLAVLKFSAEELEKVLNKSDTNE